MAIDATKDKQLANQAQRGHLGSLGALLRNIVDTLSPFSAAELTVLNGLGSVAATAAEIDRVADASARVVNLTAATLSLTVAAHDSRTVTVNKADGATITLPAAAGTGGRFRLIVGTTITSVGLVVQVANASDVMTGAAWITQDAADTVVAFEAAGTSDTITMNGTTTGGIKGNIIEVEDIATNLWLVRVMGSATGTEATPFSAAV